MGFLLALGMGSVNLTSLKRNCENAVTAWLWRLVAARRPGYR
jgi:hypothetical protein